MNDIVMRYLKKSATKFDVKIEPWLAKEMRRHKEPLFKMVRETERTQREHGTLLTFKPGWFWNKTELSPIVVGSEGAVAVRYPENKEPLLFIHTHTQGYMNKVPSFFDLHDTFRRGFPYAAGIGTMSERGPSINVYMIKTRNGSIPALTENIIRRGNESKYEKNVHKIWDLVRLREHR